MDDKETAHVDQATNALPLAKDIMASNTQKKLKWPLVWSTAAGYPGYFWNAYSSYPWIYIKDNYWSSVTDYQTSWT